MVHFSGASITAKENMRFYNTKLMQTVLLQRGASEFSTFEWNKGGTNFAQNSRGGYEEVIV